MDIDETFQVNGKPQQESFGLKNPDAPARYFPRTFPYLTTLPYETESENQRRRNLDIILKHLYISVTAGDLAVGAVHWTKELRAWLALKYDPTREQRVKLIKLYYELALAPGIEVETADKFASMFMLLAKKHRLLHPVEDLILDWRPLLHEIKQFVLPVQSGLIYDTYTKRNEKTAAKLCMYAQPYFDPRETMLMLEEFLPYFTTSFCEGAFVVVGLLNLFMPTQPVPESDKDNLPQRYLPTYFHLWNLVNRSRTFDTTFLDYFSRLARDCLPCPQVPFSEFGVFTREQASFIFTAILRMLEIPVGQATSPYSALVELSSGIGAILHKNSRRGHSAESIARWIVWSLSPICLEKEESILSHLEALIQAVETFFHPSNSGSWSGILSRLIFYLTEFFYTRLNCENSGKLQTPPEHRINDALKRRFVLCLRDVTFMGIYAKSQSSMSYALVSLQNLASLEPSLVLPRALQSIYPSMQGLVEVHRTQSSLRALQSLSRNIIRTKGYRCHITTLLGLALPGIDPNDLEKSVNALAFIQNICYNIPLEDMTKGREDVNGDFVAIQWITGELERMEEQGASLEMDYERDLSDEDEEIILRSSTTGFGEFLLSFLERVFTLLENIPDVSKLRSGSPEESVMNSLPSTFTPLLSALSPELYDTALNKIADFISNHVVHQARDTVAFIAGAFCKVHPEQALKRLIPLLILSIRTEIEENGAASTRTTGSDILPRDRALVWYVSMLSMCVVYVGREVLKYRKELFDISIYMQQKCKGIPTVHVSNFIHHLLLNLTSTFALDEAQYEPSIMERGVDIEQWGQRHEPSKLTVKWHVPDHEEIEFAVELFTLHAENAVAQLGSLINNSSSIKPDGVGKEWSDEVSRNLTLLRLLISGMSVLFEHGACSKDYCSSADSSTVKLEDEPNDQPPVDESEEITLEAPFVCPTGYTLSPEDPFYLKIHQTRYRIGEMLHKTHKYLIANQEDDVTCFSALYSVYRGFFTDVGIEKSAHVFERVSKLLWADTIQFFGANIEKDYPRALLVRRAHLYHLQRLRYNASPRPRTKQDAILLLNLVESSVSRYTGIRRQAQGTLEAALRVVLCGRRLVVPRFIRALEDGLKESNIPVIKGALFSLLYTSLERVIDRCWKWKRDVIRLYLEANSVDEPSVQTACVPAMYSIMSYSSPRLNTAFLDRKIVDSLAPQEDVDKIIEQKRNMIQRNRLFTIEEKSKLVLELVNIARTAHWKKVYGSASVAISMGIRFENLAQGELIDLIISGSIDSHPDLRSAYLEGLDTLFVMINVRGLASHKFENYYLNKWHYLSKLDVATKRYEPDWTAKFLSGFAQPEAEYYVDHDYPGWLVWGNKMPAYRPNVPSDIEFDQVEWDVRKRMGKSFDRNWFASYFKYLKQEPKDASSDKFRMSASVTLIFAFQLMIRDGLTVATFDDIKEEIASVFEDGSDKHQHRATSEILGGLIGSVIDISVEKRQMVWEYVFPMLRQIFSDGMTPENYPYWKVFIHMLMQCRDPRRLWPLVDWFSSFRLDMASNAAFKESSKISMLHQIILDAGWHFQLGEEIVKDFIEHLDHPYKGVREAVGHTLASLFRFRYHESYNDVQQLVSAQEKASSLGTRPYRPTAEFTQMMNDLFQRVRKWREEREPGQTTLSSYTSGCKTILLWLDATLTSFECIQLLPFFPTLFTEELLHMMDVKEDPELQSHAYHVFRHLSNVPHPAGEDSDFITELIRIGRNSPSWHQRLRVMINMQIIYFRRLFLVRPIDRDRLFDCVASMLEDTQHEVRAGASTTLSGMIRCSPVSLRDKVVIKFRDQFYKMLSDNTLPKKTKLSKVASASSSSTSTSNTSNTQTTDNARIVIARHAAVLGLGALVHAFPYTSPPPSWMPGVLQTLSNKAGNDSGIVGQSVKSIIGDFKKTRQDTWHIDMKAFSPDQLEDLSGVLWRSYFA